MEAEALARSSRRVHVRKRRRRRARGRSPPGPHVVLAQTLGAHDPLQDRSTTHSGVSLSSRWPVVMFFCSRLFPRGEPKDSRRSERSAGPAYLADAGQLGEQHLEDGRRQSLLQHLQQLLRLTAHGDGVGQVVHAFL